MIGLLAMHTLIFVTFSLPPGVGVWLRLLLVALPGLFCLPFWMILTPGLDMVFRASKKNSGHLPKMTGWVYFYSLLYSFYLYLIRSSENNRICNFGPQKIFSHIRIFYSANIFYVICLEIYLFIWYLFLWRDWHPTCILTMLILRDLL